MTREPSFDVHTAAAIDSSDILLVGLADIGAANLTVVDYLVSHLETTQIGFIETSNVPSVTPIEGGVPRRPIRLYRVDDVPMTILVSEVFIPVTVADRFVGALLEWAGGHDIDEICVVHGTPFPHAEAEHHVFYAATPSFRRSHWDDGESDQIDPLPGGVLDGVAGELLRDGLEARQPSVGVFVTPVHLPGPDLEAALRLLEGVETCYPIEVDERELRRQSDEMKRYYEELTSRLTALKERQQSVDSRDFPEDRMYM
ncbi:proteasome assembly chaperone family protein [Halostagnicola kamekurae]|uniref:PAC2 family protein n=1 Tax=Halostagnicola kamekurae TaxID=619731 RepID=A0A1I6TEX3_9EURY|nr:PAC2 family protein [Halostagnicola kamekurae]SFS87759.1 uncharacterized protein SAMN04488556_3060 [Halostagnicola kamekurae]